MFYSLIKVIAIGSTAVAVGSGITASIMMFPESNSKTSKYEKISNSVDEESEIEEPKQSQPAEATIPASPQQQQQTCVIYEAQPPVNDAGNKRFNKLLGRFENKESFFEKYRSGSDRPLSDNSRSDIEKACRNENSKRSVKGKVYVWWGTVKNVQMWIYSSNMHKENDDWENDAEVKRNSGNVIPSDTQ